MSMENNKMSDDKARPDRAAKPPAEPQARRNPPVQRNGRFPADPVSLGLRKLWQHAEEEPVPSEFLDLLDAIDAARSADPVPPGSGQDDDMTGGGGGQ